MKKPIVAAVAFDSESESDDSAPSPHTFRTALSSHHGGSSANTSFEERRLSKVIDGGKPQKVPWTSEEDTSLLNAIIEVGVGSWAVVAHKIQGRTGKQCRERWHNQLNPDITKAAWTTEEELVLLQAHRELGNKWVDIAKRLNGRTDNAIKNHWNSSLKRRIVEETGQLLPEDASTVRPSQASLQRTMPAAHVDQELLAAAARAARQSLEASGDCSPPPHHQQQHSSSSSKTASVTVFSMQSSSDVKKTATQSGKKQDERRARETAPQMFAAAGMLPPTPLQLKGVPSELMPDTPPSYPSMSPSQHRQFMREEEEGHGRYERKPLAPQRSHDDDEAPFHLRKPAASDSKKRRKLNDLVVMVGDEDSVRVQPQPGSPTTNSYAALAPFQPRTPASANSTSAAVQLAEAQLGISASSPNPYSTMPLSALDRSDMLSTSTPVRSVSSSAFSPSNFLRTPWTETHIGGQRRHLGDAE